MENENYFARGVGAGIAIILIIIALVVGCEDNSKPVTIVEKKVVTQPKPQRPQAGTLEDNGSGLGMTYGGKPGLSMGGGLIITYDGELGFGYDF